MNRNIKTGLWLSALAIVFYLAIIVNQVQAG